MDAECSSRTSKLPRSVPLLSLPKFLTRPVSTLIFDDRVPCLRMTSSEGRRPIYDWSAWVNSLLIPELWVSQDAPMRNLISSCAEMRISSVWDNTYISCEGDTKHELVRLMVHEAGARAAGYSSVRELEDEQRNKFRPTSSKQMKRVTRRITLIRILDLAFSFHDFCEAQNNLLDPSSCRQDAVEEAISRIVSINTMDATASVQNIENVIGWLSRKEVVHRGWLTWDLVPPALLKYRVVANCFPPIFPCGLTNSVSCFSTQASIENQINNWLAQLALHSLHSLVWRRAIHVLFSSEPSSTDSQAVFGDDPSSDFRGCFSKSLLILLLEPARIFGILSPSEIENIVAYQAQRKDGFLTFRRFVDFMSSLIAVHRQLLQFASAVPSCDNEDGSVEPHASLKYDVDNENMLQNVYFEQFLTETAEFVRIVRTVTGVYSSDASLTANVAIDFNGFTEVLCGLSAADPAKAVMECQALEFLWSKAVAQAGKDAVNCISHLLPDEALQSAPVSMSGLEQMDVGRALSASARDLAEKRNKGIETGPVTIHRGVEGSRFLCMLGALVSQYAGRGSAAIQEVMGRIMSSELPHEDLLKSEGSDLATLSDAAAGGNLFAQLILGEIAIAKKDYASGARLIVGAARAGEEVAANLLRYETQDSADQNFASLCCRCTSSSEAATLTGLVIFVRLFEEQLCCQLSACDGIYREIDFENMTAFALNNETGGSIMAADVFQACGVLLASASSEISHGRAARRLGKVWEWGFGIVARNGIYAANLYEQAIRLGIRRAYVDLASLYERGAPNFPPNGQRAFGLYQECLSHLSFGHGNKDEDDLFFICFSLMANMIYTGAGGLPRDSVKAARLYRELLACDCIAESDVSRCLTITWYPNASTQQVESTVWIRCGPTGLTDPNVECLLNAIESGRVEESHLECFVRECNVATNQRYRSVDAWIWPWI